MGKMTRIPLDTRAIAEVQEPGEVRVTKSKISRTQLTVSKAVGGSKKVKIQY